MKEQRSNYWGPCGVMLAVFVSLIVDGGSIRTYVSANALAFISERVPRPHQGTTGNQPHSTLKSDYSYWDTKMNQMTNG
jgi:hypothetical protein